MRSRSPIDLRSILVAIDHGDLTAITAQNRLKFSPSIRGRVTRMDDRYRPIAVQRVFGFPETGCHIAGLACHRQRIQRSLRQQLFRKGRKVIRDPDIVLEAAREDAFADRFL